MISPPGLVVAVDGPSGSGKSTLCRRAAAELGAAYLDTGAMYRALCWAVLADGTDPADRATAGAVAARARSLDLRMGTDPAAPSVAVGEVDVTAAVRESRISAAVSAVATNLAVRAELVARQQALVARLAPGGVVVEGRDTTTVVAPGAEVRALVVVDAAARLARRARELHGSDGEAALAATRDEVLRRDADDSTVAAFERAAPGVAVLDNSGELSDAVDRLVAWARAADSRAAVRAEASR